MSHVNIILTNVINFLHIGTIGVFPMKYFDYLHKVSLVV